MPDETTGDALAQAYLPLGNPARRSSLEGLIDSLEQAAREAGQTPEISSAAFRAGRLVRELRKKAGLSQGALAEQIGVKQSRISEIESGVGAQGPTWGVMERIYVACGAAEHALAE